MKTIIFIIFFALLAGCSPLKESPKNIHANDTPATVIEQWDYFNVTAQNNEVVSQETIGQLQRLTQKLFHRYSISIGTFDRTTLEFTDSDVVYDHQTYTVSGKITAMMQTQATTVIPTPVQWRPNSRGMMIDQSNPNISGFLLGYVEITRKGPSLKIILSPTNLIFGWDRRKYLSVADLKNAIDQNFDYINIIYHDDPAPPTVNADDLPKP